METLESSRVCRLCGKKSGISINIIDKNENHVKKINAILPIMVHEMDLLPKHMCHRCSYKLEEFHKFYVDCLKTDADLKSQLSWMRKEDSKEKIGVPMVYIENVKIKVEPPDYDVYELEPMVENVNYINSMSSVTFPVNDVQARGISEEITYAAYTRCRYCCDKKDQSKQTVSSSYETGVSRCNRPEKTDTQGDINKRLSERENPSGNKFPEIRIRSSDVRSLNDRRTSKYAANIEDIIAPFMENARGTENLSQDSKIGVKDMVIRNLRPRRRSVDYVGKRKTSKSQRKLKRIKLEQAPKCTALKMLNMKVEKPHDFEGRILRPRKVIDYIGPRRKHTTNKKKRQSVQNNNRGRKQRTQGSKEFAKNPLKNKVKLEIKEELLVGEPVFASNGSKSATVQQPRGRKKSSTLFSEDGYTLPVDSENAQNDLLNCTPVNRRVVDQSKPPKDETTRIMLKRIANAFYSPKCLRSQSAYLRNGKVKKFNESGNSVKRQKKVIQNITGRGQRSAKNSTQTTNTIVNVRQISGSNTKLVENIKHYCEKCNISFANLELYRLHACYD